MKKSFLIVGCSFITTLIMSGCSVSSPVPVSNSKIGENSLYANTDNDSKIISIINDMHHVKKGFKINDYSPIGYNVSFKKHVASCLWNSDLEVHSKYESIETGMKPTDVFTNIILLPLTLPLGFACGKYHIFNFKEFDIDAKTAINETDKKSLLSSYDNIISISENEQNEVNKAIKKINSKYSKEIDAIINPYKIKINNIEPKINIADKSGFYTNEKIPINVKAVLNKIPSKYSIADNINYRNFVNKSFPCKSVSMCEDNIKSNKTKILAQSKKDLNQSKINMQEHLSKDILKFKKATATYSVYNGDLNRTIIVHKKYDKIIKTYSCKVETPKIINFSSNSIPTKIIVENVNYSNIFPAYENHNKDISLIFDNKNLKYTFVNKTNQFIQIKSLSMYYNNSIVDLMKALAGSDNNKYISELSPKSHVTMDLYRTINESKYEHITAKDVRNKKVSFGFAVKYTKGEQIKNITLFKLEKKPLYPILKKF